MVVGSGPAGIAAAITASQRGHKVSLYEQKESLGGQFAFAVKPESKNTMSRMLEGMLGRLRRSEVVVHEGTTVSPKLITREAPEVVVVATGAHQRRPEIDGLSRQEVITSFEFFENSDRVKGNRILILGAGMVGLEVAEMLLAQGRTVVACRRSDTIGADMDPISRKMILNKIGNHPNLSLMPGTTLTAFNNRGVEAVCDGERVVMEPFTTVILCSGMEPETALADHLQDFPGELVIIGDADTPSNIDHAFSAGVAAGNRL